MQSFDCQNYSYNYYALRTFEKITKEFFAVNSIQIIECASEEDAKKIAIKRSGSDPYPVYFFESDTSGEKLYEEFYTSDDIVSLDAFVSLGIIKCKGELNRKQIYEVIKELKEIVNNKDKGMLPPNPCYYLRFS